MTARLGTAKSATAKSATAKSTPSVTALSVAAEAALAPLRAAVRAAAEQKAAVLTAAARGDTEAIARDAKARADAILDEATAAGEASARAEAALRTARIRRQGRSMVLASERRMDEEWHRRVSEAARAVQDTPEYRKLLAGLTEQAHALLGPKAVVTPVDEGGVVARAGSRRVDLRLASLVSPAVERVRSREGDPWQQ